MEIDVVLAFFTGMLVGIGVCFGMFIFLARPWNR